MAHDSRQNEQFAPQQTAGDILSEPSSASSRLEQVARFIEANAAEKLTLETLAYLACMSKSHFQKAFTKRFSVSPKTFQDATRLRQLKTSLKSGEDISSAILQSGYGSNSRVYEGKNQKLGVSPKQYKQGLPNETLKYLIHHSALGPLMMAASSTGVCFAEFGESKEALSTKLQNEFPSAKLDPASPSDALCDWMQALDKHLADHGPAPDLPLDLRGSAFQISVWQFLKQMEPGTTISYKALAEAIGKPGASRAVGSACGANKIAVLIPCHRVLRSDGNLGGYRWGLERKQMLLTQEQSKP